jgi:hypothetical protein
MGGDHSKNTTLECILNNFKKGFNGNYRVKVTLDKLRTFHETDWPASGVGWLSEGSLDKVIVNRVFEVVVGKPRHPDQFHYIDSCQDAVLSWPTWLKPHLEEPHRVMVARVATASKCKEKCKKPKKPTLAGDPEETLPPYVSLYLPLPLPSAPLPLLLEGEASDREALATIMSTRLGPGVLETATTPPSSVLMNLIFTPSSPVLIPHSL